MQNTLSTLNVSISEFQKGNNVCSCPYYLDLKIFIVSILTLCYRRILNVEEALWDTVIVPQASLLMLMCNADPDEVYPILITNPIGLCLCNRHQYSSNGTMSPGAVGDCSYFSGTPETSLQGGECLYLVCCNGNE